MTEERLHQLLGRYYDGLTTLAEERALRRALARYEGADRDLTAARAVMAFAQAAGSRRAAPRAQRRRGTLAAAASVAVAAAIAAALWTALPHTAGESECYAVIGGHRTDDSATALALMDSQLAAIGSASEAVDADVSSDLGLFGDFL